MKILTLGMDMDLDFGHPSLQHGFENLVETVDSSNHIVHYQFGSKNPEKYNDLKSEVRVLKCSYKTLFFQFLKYKFKLSIPENFRRFFNEIKESDYIFDLFGIRFCDRFTDYSNKPFSFYRYLLSEFCPLIICRLMKKKIIKTECSYGPIENKKTKRVARFMCKKVYWKIFAREVESKRCLENVVKNKEIKVLPDLANFFNININEKQLNSKIVGISTSFQIERQYPKYVDFIVNLCCYLNKRGFSILLIPNQQLPDGERDDVVISYDIAKLLQEKNVETEVVDIRSSINSTVLKEKISACSFLVGARYHSCVAALSMGVPTIAFGWHHKYRELMELYGCSQFVFDIKNLDEKVFYETIMHFIKNYEKISEEIKRKSLCVKKSLCEAFTKDVLL